jgi:hypothetical protein
MKLAVLLTLLAVLTPATQAASLDLTAKDIQSVEIELKAGTKPRLRIFFSKPALERAQQLVAENLDTPFPITMNGTVVVTPRLKEPFQARARFLSLLFPDFESAAAAARLLVPTS